MRRSLSVGILVAAVCITVAADLGGETERVVFLGPATPVVVHAGRSGKALLGFRVGAGFHVNSNTPKSELLIPTQLFLTPSSEVGAGKISYPAGVDATFPFAPTETLNVYAGRLVITVQLNAGATTPPGTYRMQGRLKYQACDDRACYPPKQLPFEFEVTVKKASASKPNKSPAKPVSQ